MIVAAVIDGWKFKVPNWLTLPLVLSGWAIGLLHDFTLRALLHDVEMHKTFMRDDARQHQPHAGRFAVIVITKIKIAIFLDGELALIRNGFIDGVAHRALHIERPGVELRAV